MVSPSSAAAINSSFPRYVDVIIELDKMFIQPVI